MVVVDIGVQASTETDLNFRWTSEGLVYQLVGQSGSEAEAGSYRNKSRVRSQV